METGSGNRDVPVFYRHKKRPDWGLALPAMKRAEKTGFQFADGKLRLFHDDFLHLFEPVDVVHDEAMRLADQLRRQATRAVGRRVAQRKARREGVRIPSLDDQIKWFQEHYADGFSGEAWGDQARGGEGRRLKRHRDGAIEEAQEKLGAEALAGISRRADVVDATCAILAKTNLVPPREVKQLKALSPEARDHIGAALFELLHGDGSFEARMESWIGSLGPHATWKLVTAPLALFDPVHQICVTPSSFTRQARWMAPNLLDSDSHPSADLYRRWRRMVLAIRDRLTAAKLEPKDLLDVHDFIGVTLAPSALGR